MRDVAKKKEQELKELEALKRGNEYSDHYKQKVRVGELLKRGGWVCKYEHEVLCVNPHTGERNKYPYCLDVYGFQYLSHQYVKVGVEINREETGGGHGSKITIPKDRNRAQDIWDQHKIKVIAFNVSHLKAASDLQVLKEIYQHLGL